MTTIIRILIIFIVSIGLIQPVYAESKNPFIPQLPEIIEPEVEPIPVIQPTDEPDRISRNPRPNSETQVVVKEPEPPKIPPFSLTGLIWKSDRPQAILNGNVVDVGDTVSDAKIVNIDKTGVYMEYEGLKIMVRL